MRRIDFLLLLVALALACAQSEAGSVKFGPVDVYANQYTENSGGSPIARVRD